MRKNVAGQKISVYAYDTSANAAKTGDAANITAYISKDGAAAAQSNDVNPTEIDATNMPGVYVFDLTQAETNADHFVLAAKSATANIILDPVSVEVFDTVTNVLAGIIDGTLDLQTALKNINAYIQGNLTINESTGAVTYKDLADATLWTNTVDANNTTRTRT